MNLKKKSIVFLMTMAIVTFFITEVVNFYTTLENEKQSLYKSDKERFKDIINFQYNQLNIIGTLLASDPTVLQGYIDRDSKILKRRFNALWEKRRKERLFDELHFFDNKSRSFMEFYSGNLTQNCGERERKIPSKNFCKFI